MHAAISQPTLADTTPSHLELLEDAMRTERRLLDGLIDVLDRQRSAVATDDLVLLDDSVFAAQRVLLTLGEARRRRRTLLGIVTGEEGLHLVELEEAIGPEVTASLRAARDELRGAARRLAAAIERNRVVLGGALSAGDHLIRLLCGAPDKPAAYGASGHDAQAGGTLLIDTQA